MAYYLEQVVKGIDVNYHKLKEVYWDWNRKTIRLTFGIFIDQEQRDGKEEGLVNAIDEKTIEVPMTTELFTALYQAGKQEQLPDAVPNETVGNINPYVDAENV